MAREKKDGKMTNFYLEKEVVELLEKYSEETGIPKTTIVEKAIRNFLTSQKNTLQQRAE